MSEKMSQQKSNPNGPNGVLVLVWKVFFFITIDICEHFYVQSFQFEKKGGKDHLSLIN